MQGTNLDIMKHYWQLSSLILLGLSLPAKAQLATDSSLGTQLIPNMNIKGIPSDRVEGGEIRGANLFHSFSNFNAITGATQSGVGGLFSSGDSNITASSKADIDGEVKIVSPEVKQQNNLIVQTKNSLNTEQIIATSCWTQKNAANDRFLVTSWGNLPIDPDSDVNIPYSLLSVYSVAISNLPNQTKIATNDVSDRRKVEYKLESANKLVSTPDGKVLLIVLTDALQARNCAAN